MATIGTTALTLADWAKRVDPDGKIDHIVDILSETNEILDDALWVEGNLPTGHRTTVRTGLPTAAWRQLNYGIQPSKSTTKQITDACGMLEAYAEIDKELADLNGNTSAFRTSEDTAFLEAMNQEMVDTLFYGNTDVDPEKFLGLAPRFNDLAAEDLVRAHAAVVPELRSREAVVRPAQRLDAIEEGVLLLDAEPHLVLRELLRGRDEIGRAHV